MAPGSLGGGANCQTLEFEIAETLMTCLIPMPKRIPIVVIVNWRKNMNGKPGDLLDAAGRSWLRLE